MKLIDLWNTHSSKIENDTIVFDKPIEIKRLVKDPQKPVVKHFIKKIYKNKDGVLKAEVEEKNYTSWLNTSTYATPEENLTQKLSDSLKRDFGAGIYGVTDHDYVTNSYHIDPAQTIDWANKIVIESKLMDKSTGGAISYIELPDVTKNLEVVESMLQYMYDHILYCELNVKRDICYKCGYQGVIKIVKDNDKRIWECPICRNRDTSLMFINRRVCGYIGSAKTGAAQARMGDYEARTEHVDIPLSGLTKSIQA